MPRKGGETEATLQQFPLEFLFVVLQWFNGIAENIFSWTFAAEIGYYAKKTSGKRAKTAGNSFRGHLSMPGMPDMMRERFDRVPDPISARCISLSDCLMSGLAVSGFKLPSLPRFDRKVRGGEDPVMARSPRSLFGVARAPPDAHMGHADARASWRGPRAGASPGFTRPRGAAGFWTTGACPAIPHGGGRDVPSLLEGEDDNLHVGHGPAARPEHGAGGHALRPSAVGH